MITYLNGVPVDREVIGGYVYINGVNRGKLSGWKKLLRKWEKKPISKIIITEGESIRIERV